MSQEKLGILLCLIVLAFCLVAVHLDRPRKNRRRRRLWLDDFDKRLYDKMYGKHTEGTK